MHLSLVHGHDAILLVCIRCDLDAQERIIKASHVLRTSSSINGQIVGYWGKNWKSLWIRNTSTTDGDKKRFNYTGVTRKTRHDKERLHNRRWLTCQDSTKTLDFHPKGCLTLTWIGKSEMLALVMSTSKDIWKMVHGLMQSESLVISNKQQPGYKQVDSVLLYYHKAAINFCLTWHAVLLTAHILLCCPNPW